MPIRFDRWIRLERFHEDGSHAEQRGAPWPPQSREEPEPYSLPPRITSGVPSARLLARGGRRSASGCRLAALTRDAALGARGQLVAQPDVGERAADHHLVVCRAGRP